MKKYALGLFLIVVIFIFFRFVYRHGPGMIEECNLNAEKVYILSPNATGGSVVVDKNNIIIGSCSPLNSIPREFSCDELKLCSPIYTSPNNIFGESAILKIRSIPLIIKNTF